MDSCDSKRTAYHEAGHALVAYLEGIETGRVTVLPGTDAFGDQYLGLHQQADEITLDDWGIEFTEETAEKYMRVTCAGAEAERLVFGGGEMAGRDREIFSDLAVRHAPRDEDGIPNGEVFMDEAYEMLEANREALGALAEALLEQETLDGHNIETILDEHELSTGPDASVR